MMQVVRRLTKPKLPTIPQEWGEANPYRGLNYHTVALQFVKDWPIGSTLTNEQFDKWAHEHGYLNYPENAPTSSDVWLAHLQRRHQLKFNLFKASTHPRMQELGGECFVISKAGQGSLMVEKSSTALLAPHFASKLESLIGTKRKQLSYLIQSADLTQMRDWQQAIASELFNEVDEWNDDLKTKTKRLDAKFSRLVAAIQRDVERGRIPSDDPAVRLLEQPDPDEPDGE